ncbi:hypothetical protein C0J45_19354 [Silurus meridionalis]|nr:hypothetical protein C0J45_19354 [Silurus meridionalis]
MDRLTDKLLRHWGGADARILPPCFRIRPPKPHPTFHAAISDTFLTTANGTFRALNFEPWPGRLDRIRRASAEERRSTQSPPPVLTSLHSLPGTPPPWDMEPPPSYETAMKTSTLPQPTMIMTQPS